MKRYLLIPFVFAALNLKAQNTFPSSGNVGIGTLSPGSKLEISDNGENVNNLKLYKTTGGANLLELSTNFQGGNTFAINPAISGVNNGGFEIRDVTNGVSRIVIAPMTGNVGIGTTAPSSKLDVQGGAINIGTGANIFYKAGAYFSAGNMAFGNAPYISFNAFLTTSDIPSGVNAFSPSYNAGGGLILSGEAGGSGLHFLQKNYLNGTAPYNLSSYQENLTLSSNGNLGVGTANPTEKLCVNGTVLAKKLKVQATGWSDYVFASNYKLSSIASLDAFIKKHKHLPDVPSAVDIQKNGMDIAKTQAALLRKIEELTLYIIKQDKKIENQNMIIIKQNNRLSSLEQKYLHKNS